MKLKKINYGIACRIGDVIYMNKKLRKYPPLYKAIFEHEKAHTSGFSLKDIVLDIKNSHLKGLKHQYYHFLFTTPSSWIEFLPFWWYEGKISINPLLTGLYGFIILLILSIWWFLK